MKSAAFLHIMYKTFEISTSSNPNLPQLQFVDSHTLQHIDKTTAKSTFCQQITSSYNIAYYYSFAWLIQDAPKVPKLIPQASQSASWELSQAPKTLENSSKCKQSVKTYTKNNEHIVYIRSPAPKHHRQRSQCQRFHLKGPGFNTGSAGPRRAYIKRDVLRHTKPNDPNNV